MGQHAIPRKHYYNVFGWLIVLLVLTVGAAYVDTGHHWINNVVAMTIAVAKMMLIILIFMHVRWSSKLTWVFVGGGFFWLLILFVFTLSDVFSRHWPLEYVHGW